MTIFHRKKINRVNFFLKRIGTGLVAGKAEMARKRSGYRFFRKAGMTVCLSESISGKRQKQ